MALARFKKVCLDAVEPDRLGRFWADVLGLEWRPYPHGEGGVFGTAERPVLWINRVPADKTVKHRIHLDVYAEDLTALAELGARVIRPEGDGGIQWTVLADPEGGEFCAFRPPIEPAAPPADRQRSVVVDSADPLAQAVWWGQVLGVPAQHHNGFSSLREVPRLPFESLDFVPVPEPKAGMRPTAPGNCATQVATVIIHSIPIPIIRQSGASNHVGRLPGLSNND